VNDNTDPLIAQALAQGCTQAEAARRADVSDRTVRRRLDEPAFKMLLTSARDQLLKNTADRFTSLQDKALDTIEQAMTEGGTADQLRAARMVLEIGDRYRDRVELESRLIAVEQIEQGS
jgi:hypothetical protein